MTDTYSRPDLVEHPAVTEYGVSAHAETPMVTADNYTLGTICVVDTDTSDWTDNQLAFLAHLPETAM